ncbi:MAG: 4Fe-4S binding protein, partial [Candidatus Eisenbacteria bacterium]
AEEVGLVLLPGNAKDALFICTCCGCCCGVLRAVKFHPRPASVVSSAFAATLSVDSCNGCGVCAERCQMEAIRVNDGKAALNPDRCIGCGLCVSTCPAECVTLFRKPEARQPYVPKDTKETYLRLGRARGKFSTPELIGMQVRSKLDRLLARGYERPKGGPS